MNYKKLVSMFLSLVMFFSCLTAVSFTAQAAETLAPLVNLIQYGDMENSNATFTGVGERSYVKDEALTGDADNYVLKIDGSAIDKATKLTLGSSLTPVEAGHTYWIDFDYKVATDKRVTVRVKDGENLVNTIASSGTTANTWYRLSENINTDYFNKSNIYTATATVTNFADIIVGTGVKKTKLYIDNLEFYDITNAVNFNPSVSINGVEIDSFGADNTVNFAWKSGVAKIGNEVKTVPGSEVSFTAQAPEGYIIDDVLVDGNPVSVNNGVYSFIMPDSAEPEVHIITGEDRGIPNIVSVSPENCVNMDPCDAVVTVSFDREIDINTLTEDNILVQPSATFSAEAATEDYTYRLVFDELSAGTEYTLTFTNGVQTDRPMGLEEDYEYKFSTHSVANIIENGDMSEDTDLYYINSTTSPSYKTFNGERVLYFQTWKADTTSINQYISGDNRADKYELLPGHRYYAEAKVYAESDIKIAWRIIYATKTDSSNVTHPTSANWIDVKAGEWTSISCLFAEIPSNVVPASSGYGIRLVADSTKVKDDQGNAVGKAVGVYIDDWELYDCTIAPATEPELVSFTPATTEVIQPGSFDVELEFNTSMRLISKEDIEVTGAEITGTSLSADKKHCTLNLDKVRANRNITIKLKSLKSLAGQLLPEETFTYEAKYVDPKTPDITVTLGGDIVTAGSNIKTYANGLKMEIKSDVHMEGPFDKDSFECIPENLIDKVEWSVELPDIINVVFNQAALVSGGSYSVTLLPTIQSQAGTSINETTIAFETMTVAETVDLYQTVVQGNDRAGLINFLNTNYKDLNNEDTLFSEVIYSDSTLLNQFVTDLLSSTDSSATAEEISETVWETAILTIANESNDTSAVKKSVESILNQAEKTGLKNTYTDFLTSTIQNTLFNKIVTETADFANAEEYISFVEEDIILNAFRNSNGWAAVQKIFNDNKAFFAPATQALIDMANNSQYYTDIYGSLQGMNASGESQVYNLLYAACYADYSNDIPGGVIGGITGGGGGAVAIPMEGSNKDSVSENQVIFSDVASVPWAVGAIEYLYDLNVINGKTEDMFYPGDFVKREEFVKMIVIAANIPLTEQAVNYTDVLKSAWFYPYVAAASNSGLINGIGNNVYGVGQNITRQDIAVVCSRLLTKADEPLKDEIVNFADQGMISDYAKKAVDKVAYLGLMIGNENLEFSPREYATRAETAVILQRLIALLNQYGTN